VEILDEVLYRRIFERKSLLVKYIPEVSGAATAKDILKSSTESKAIFKFLI
jgi:hypothetical protein